ncbi:MAG: hypothetical protein QY323_03045 [Patescibacteria group bacterium]|nr:MAG: hypothetical protein QY323_03045 [Patescibacteria group bacterium]
MNLPLILVWIITLAVFLIVVGVGVSYRAKGTPIGMALATFAAITIVATGFTVGFLVTHFSSPTPETWWWALAVRVAWQLGGALFFAITILSDAQLGSIGFRKAGPWIFVLACAAVGTLASLNPLRDLANGPFVTRGVAEIEVDRSTRIRGGARIWAQMYITTVEGERYTFSMVGWAAEKTEEILKKCEGTNEVEVTMLRYTKRVLDARCQPPSPAPEA